MYVYQNSGKTVSVMVDGRSLHIPNGEPWEVPAITSTDNEKEYTTSSAKVGALVLRLAALSGVVELQPQRNTRGITFAIESADEASSALRKEQQLNLLNRYVDGAKQDQIANIPVKPPGEVLQGILDQFGLDLSRDYGIRPVGYKVSDVVQARDKEMSDQRKEIEDLKDMVANLVSLLEAKTQPEETVGGKKK